MSEERKIIKMNFNKLESDDFKTLISNGEKDRLEQVQENQIEQYISAYNLYRQLFTEYMINILQLKKYDSEILDSNLKFKPISDGKMDAYQYFSSDELKFIYLRNNIYIHRLNEKEMQFLLDRNRDSKENLDDEAKQFIEDTYRKVIFEDVGKDGEICTTFYGPNSENFMAKNNSLILGVRYDEFDSNGLDDDTWDEFHIKQMNFLGNLFYKINCELKDKVSVPIVILQYNDFSIIQKNLDIKMEGEER